MRNVKIVIAVLAGMGAAAAGARMNLPFVPNVSIQLDVPAELANRKLARLGYVDVTAAPFSADPTGKADATKALQAAIDFARDRQMVAFFPPGEYVVGDTLRCIHGRHDPVTRRRRRDGRDWPCVLVGSRRAGPRPRIVLAPRSEGFGDPNRPRYVVHFWARAVDEGDYDDTQPNINMNQMLVGIDVVTGEGNAGAVGIRHRAAQGSSVQDCTIDARGGLCGLEGGAGSGGSHIGVTVLGGRIGADLRQTQPATTITGFRLLDQTHTALLVEGRQAVTAVGLHIRTEAAGPAIVTRQSYPHHGQLCLVDGLIEFARGGENLAIDARASLTMHNVFLRNVARLVRAPGAPGVETTAEWSRVDEYAVGVDPPQAPRWLSKRPLQYTSGAWVDGVRAAGRSLVSLGMTTRPPADLVDRHLWARGFPTFESPGCANVKDAAFGAVGDGEADDTAAIQKAVDTSEVVFLPKGVYRVTRTLTLRADTKLIGIHPSFSAILAAAAPGGDFVDAGHPRPVVQTVDDADAETALAFLKIAITYRTPGAYCVDWRCGRRSVFRSVHTILPHWWWAKDAPKQPVNHPLVVVRGAGGGKWYNFHEACRRWHGADYRHLLIDGTAGPLHLYQCNPEYGRGAAEMEIRRSKHVSIYGLKGEYNAPILLVRDSDHVRVFGYGGNAAGWPGKSLFVVERTPNFLLANLADSPRLGGRGKPDEAPGIGVDPEKWHMLIERPIEGGEFRTPPRERPALYRRGKPKANPPARPAGEEPAG